MMQELHFGHVVQSISGRDRLRVFIVIGTREIKSGYVALTANGVLHTAEKPKVKNPKHLKIIAELTDSEKAELTETPSNEKIVNFCNKYDNFPKKI